MIIAIAGQPVKDFEDLTTYLARSGKVGQQVELTVIRDGKETTVTLTLAARPASQAESASSNAASGRAQDGPQRRLAGRYRHDPDA